MSDLLSRRLAEHLDAVVTPAADLTAVRRRARTRQRRRTTALVTGAGLAAAALLGAALLGGHLDIGGSGRGTLPRIAGTGEVDLGGGLRAYGDPGGDLVIGGRTFDASDLSFLDTDAAPTALGVAYYDGGRPVLLAADGTRTRLLEAAGSASPGFHPTIKADAPATRIVFATRTGDTATLTVFDLEEGEVLAQRQLDCGDACDSLRLEALDGDWVLVSDEDGVRAWHTVTGDVSRIAGPATEVADLRAGVLLYDGRAPGTLPSGWRAVAGAVDAQLSADGRYVLSWSSTLQSTDGSAPVVLEAGPAEGGGPAWWTMDTDGSVLVAHAVDYPRTVVSDCVLPSGRCTEIGRFTPRGGDPMFIGNDM